MAYNPDTMSFDVPDTVGQLICVMPIDPCMQVHMLCPIACYCLSSGILKAFSPVPQDMVYVSGLPPNVTEDEVAEHFGSIGILKVDKKKVSQLACGLCCCLRVKSMRWYGAHHVLAFYHRCWFATMYAGEEEDLAIP